MDNIDFSKFSKNFADYIQKTKNTQEASGEVKIDRKTFEQKISNDASLFQKLDLNKDGYVSENEYYTIRNCDIDGDGKVSDEEVHSSAMRDAEFSAKRHIDKWFSFDVNRDGLVNNAEAAFMELRMCDDNYVGL